MSLHSDDDNAPVSALVRRRQADAYPLDQSRGGQGEDGSPTTPLYQIFWARWQAVLASFGCAVFLAQVYLLFATPIYTPVSNFYIEQNAPKVAAEEPGYAIKDDSFLPTQLEVVRSEPILEAALQQADWQSMKTFAPVASDPLGWLRSGSAFRVEVGKKDDVMSVSLDTPYPAEGAKFVNAVVDCYINQESRLKRQTGTDMVRILESQKADVEKELNSRLNAMLTFKADNGALSFTDQDRGNIILERLAALSTSLTEAELARLDLQTRYEQLEKIIQNPDDTAKFVLGQQLNQKDWGDKSYDDLVSQLWQAQTSLTAMNASLGSTNPRAQIEAVVVNNLAQKVHEKERSMAEANAVDVGQQLAAAQAKEQSIRSELAQQQQQATDLNVKATEFQRLTADVDRAQKENDLLDARIKEVQLNTTDAGSLSITVLAPARVEKRPSKPKRSFVLAAAGVLGLIFGSGLALVQEYRDKRLRSLDDVSMVLGIPIVGMVPRMPNVQSAADRGQHVFRQPMSEAAEAYRTIRTSLHFGRKGALVTILVTSPTPGDGKSTTASNIAIAMAQAGHRTLLVDADLRRPTQHQIFEVDGETGLSSILSGQAKLDQVVRATPIEGLSLLPAGPIPANPSEMLGSLRFSELLKLISDEFDRVVIDSPPVLPVTDAKIIAASTDATVLVVRIDKSDRRASAMALEGLQSVGANVVGWVANDVTLGQGGYGSYYGGYYGQKESGADVDPRENGAHINGNGNGQFKPLQQSAQLPSERYQ